MAIITLSGEAIRIGRAIKGWSQRELGKRTGLTPWRVWALENSVCAQRPEEMAKILRALSAPRERGHGR